MPDSKPINAGPTKAFFVRMLTRDIDLADAILDLLDNCVDGVSRELQHAKHKTKDGKPYKGFEARIIANPAMFEILDNCGGIPQDIAEKSAFMLGRPDVTRDADVETVGMYGIGMKRAMFKMGRRSEVVSQPKTGPYKVEIPPEWLNDEPTGQAGADAKDPWKLELVPLDASLTDYGTRIVVRDLYDEIARQFNSEESAFLTDLEKEIARHYAIIMDKGFSVYLNGVRVEPVALTLLAPGKFDSADDHAIQPYVFTGSIGEVTVELAVGFYRPLATEAELEDEEVVSSSRENAGWTVICNDRVVLFNDKTHKTGWGTKGVTPGYHNQFISIRGIVAFRSKNSMALPLNTTKRGLDTDSGVYQSVIEHMRAGLKHFTSFTNKWKKREEETTGLFKELSLRTLGQVVAATKSGVLSNIRNKPGVQQFVPALPKPEDTRQKQRRICFAADEDDVVAVAIFYFDDEDHDRSEVARRCFDESLKRAKRGR